MPAVSLTRGPEACAAVHTTHCYDEQSVGAGAVFVQVGEFRGAVVVAKLKHLGGIGNGVLWEGQCHPVCFTYILKLIWVLLFNFGGDKFLLHTSSCSSQRSACLLKYWDKAVYHQQLATF